jgi:hypothetical protein
MFLATQATASLSAGEAAFGVKAQRSVNAECRRRDSNPHEVSLTGF